MAISEFIEENAIIKTLTVLVVAAPEHRFQVLLSLAMSGGVCTLDPFENWFCDLFVKIPHRLMKSGPSRSRGQVVVISKVILLLDIVFKINIRVVSPMASSCLRLLYTRRGQIFPAPALIFDPISLRK